MLEVLKQILDNGKIVILIIVSCALGAAIIIGAYQGNLNMSDVRITVEMLLGAAGTAALTTAVLRRKGGGSNGLSS